MHECDYKKCVHNDASPLFCFNIDLIVLWPRIWYPRFRFRGYFNCDIQIKKRQRNLIPLTNTLFEHFKSIAIYARLVSLCRQISSQQRLIRSTSMIQKLNELSLFYTMIYALKKKKVLYSSKVDADISIYIYH